MDVFVGYRLAGTNDHWLASSAILWLVAKVDKNGRNVNPDRNTRLAACVIESLTFADFRFPRLESPAMTNTGFR
ncbi:hypothetical protein MN186_00320 [Aliiroseovarius sp. N1F302]|uniref:hypothetical protein n=1 Tax=Aliiroseovarius sediminis TaxID=2925839 RepID=UPI001F563E83|nr:hypothetical protein [Aliiroseovarius sediminis]MCI2392927.1 hypothetical protein [Aliiroseovarius sediminis]